MTPPPRGVRPPAIRSAWAAACPLVASAVLLAACVSGAALAGRAAAQVQSSAARVDDLLPVDCLLPGQVRRLGRQIVYVAPRRPIKTTAGQCEIRGGEYVAYDRAGYQTALAVWKPLADQGDATAQTYVGEIFEKGLGVTPDHATAAQWYRRAADQGNARAAMNLGTLYERGLGVPRDPAQALHWYRRATGLPEIGFEVSAQPSPADEKVGELRRQLQEAQGELERSRRELEDLRRRLEQRQRERDTDAGAIDQLRREVDELRRKEKVAAETLGRREGIIREGQDRLAAKDRDLADLQQKLAGLQGDLVKHQEHVKALEAAARSSAGRPGAPGEPAPAARADQPVPRDVRRALGRYHALVVGNDAYPSFPRDAQLQTAANDAREVARTLKEQYDFQVTVLLNATRQQLMSALNEMRDRLTEKDNFLLYYAGHGKWDEVNKSGHWVPVDGHPADSTNWIHTRSVTEILNLMAAQQVLVVADACYAGSLAIRGGIGRVRGLDAIRALARERSRVLLASGGIEPVLDRVSGRHSVFAKHFLQVLRDNGGVLTGVELFDRLRDPVATEAQGVGVAQSPQYSLLQFAGHQGGDFLFVRAAAAR